MSGWSVLEAAGEDLSNVGRPSGGGCGLCHTHSLTAETFRALRESGRRIGAEVALIGTDDDQWNQMVEPSATVVVQPVEQLGRWAGQLLAARAKGQSPDNARITLDPVLSARASTAT